MKPEGSFAKSPMLARSEPSIRVIRWPRAACGVAFCIALGCDFEGKRRDAFARLQPAVFFTCAMTLTEAEKTGRIAGRLEDIFPLYKERGSALKGEAMADMEQQIEHRHLPIRGLNLHVAQAGKGDKGAVLFLHGFPEIWYSWRHQMLAVAAAGYLAVAPDWRGYGLSDQPPEEEEVSYNDLLDDVLGILDALSVPKAFIVGKDFGAVAAYDFVLRHPDRICGVMCLGIPFTPFAPSFAAMPEGFYMSRWLEPGRAEADFGRYDVKRVVRTIYVLFSSSEIPIAREDQEITDLADLSTPLPEWFSEEDLAVYASLYEKSGFRYPLKMPYRSIHKRHTIEDPKFQVPVFLVMGEKDYVYRLFEPVLKDGVMGMFAPDLKIAYIPEGSHFVQEQFPDKVNELLVGFLEDHPGPPVAV